MFHFVQSISSTHFIDCVAWDISSCVTNVFLCLTPVAHVAPGEEVLPPSAGWWNVVVFFKGETQSR